MFFWNHPRIKPLQFNIIFNRPGICLFQFVLKACIVCSSHKLILCKESIKRITLEIQNTDALTLTSHETDCALVGAEITVYDNCFNGCFVPVYGDGSKLHLIHG